MYHPWDNLENSFYFFLIIMFCLLRVTPAAYGSSQARGPIGAVAASLCHSQGNLGSELSLRPTLQLMAVPDPEPID